eukprot:tig00020996_g16926.t1
MQGHFSSAPGTPVDRARALYLPSSAGRPRLGSARAVDPSCLLRQVRRSTTLAPRTFRVSSLSAPAASVAAGDRPRTCRGLLSSAPAALPVGHAWAPHPPWTHLACSGRAAGRPHSRLVPSVCPACLRRQLRWPLAIGPRTCRGLLSPAPAALPGGRFWAPHPPWIHLACTGSAARLRRSPAAPSLVLMICAGFGGRRRLGPGRALDSSRLRLASSVRFPALDPSRLHRVRRPAPPLSCRAVPRPYDLRRQFRWLPALGPRTCRGLLSPAPGPPPGLFSSAQAAGPVGHAWASHPPWILLACTGRAAGRIARSPYLPWVLFACAGSFGGRRRSSPARAVDFSRLRLQRCRAVAHWRDIFHPSYLSAPASARSIVAAPQP